MQLWFFFLQGCCFPLVSQNISLGPGGWRGCLDPQGLRDYKPTPLLSQVLVDLLVTVGVFTSRHVVQGGSGRSAGGQGLVPLFLKPKQDYLHFNFPNSIHGRSILTRWYRQQLASAIGIASQPGVQLLPQPLQSLRHSLQSLLWRKTW